MARDTTVKDGVMHFALWLVFHRDGTCRMTRGRPDLDRDERGMALNVEVPLSLFRTPELRAAIAIDDAGEPRQQIDVTAAANALSEAIGCEVFVTVREPSE